MENAPKVVVKKDLYYAMMILSASVVVSSLILIGSGQKMLMILGGVKLLIGLPIVIYTYKHKVGQRVEVVTGSYDHYKSKSF